MKLKTRLLPRFERMRDNPNLNIQELVELVENTRNIDLFTSFDSDIRNAIAIFGGRFPFDPIYTEIFLREQKIEEHVGYENLMAYSIKAFEIVNPENNFLEFSTKQGMNMEGFDFFPNEKGEVPTIRQENPEDICFNMVYMSDISITRGIKKDSLRYFLQKVNDVPLEQFKYIPKPFYKNLAYSNITNEFYVHSCDIDTADMIYAHLLNRDILNVNKKICSSISELVYSFGADSLCFIFDPLTGLFLFNERFVYSMNTGVDTLNFETLNDVSEFMINSNDIFIPLYSEYKNLVPLGQYFGNSGLAELKNSLIQKIDKKDDGSFFLFSRKKLEDNLDFYLPSVTNTIIADKGPDEDEEIFKLDINLKNSDNMYIAGEESYNALRYKNGFINIYHTKPKNGYQTYQKFDQLFDDNINRQIYIYDKIFSRKNLNKGVI